MTKKTSSIVKLAIVAVVVIIGAILTSCSWEFPNFYNKGGIYAIYEADSSGVNNFDERLNQTQNRLMDWLTQKGYDATVTTEGGNKLRVEVPDVADPLSIFELIGKPCQVVFVVDDVVVMSAKDKLTAAEALYDTQHGGYIVSLKFNSDGKTEFGNVTGKHIGESMSVYLSYDSSIKVGDSITNFADSAQLVTTATINEVVYEHATISGNFDQEAVENLATQIECGTFPLALRLVSVGRFGLGF